MYYYLQDSRQYVGNDLLFWAKGRCGYTTNIDKAHVFTEEDAFAQNRCRETDIPWPKYYIDDRVRPAVDHQDLELIDIVLDRVGMKKALHKPEKQKMKKEIYRCHFCGKFVSEKDYYLTVYHDDLCPNCV